LVRHGLEGKRQRRDERNALAIGARLSLLLRIVAKPTLDFAQTFTTRDRWQWLQGYARGKN